MHTSSSANRTWSAFSSASENTATVLMPSSRHAWMMRSAISPRLAIRIFLNIWLSRAPGAGLRRPDGEQPFAVVNGSTVLHVHLHDFTVAFGVDLVHQLHRFDDAEHLTGLHHL